MCILYQETAQALENARKCSSHLMYNYVQLTENTHTHVAAVNDRTPAEGPLSSGTRTFRTYSGSIRVTAPEPQPPPHGKGPSGQD